MIRWLPLLLTVACVEDVTLARWPDAREAPDVAPPDVTDAEAPDVADVTDVPDAPDVPPDAPPVFVQAVVAAALAGEGARMWQSAVTVTLSRGDAGLTGAAVALTSATGTVALTPGSSGRYQASLPGFGGPYALTVTPPGGAPQTARWSTFAPHSFTAPRGEETVPALTPLALMWAPTGAMEAQIVAPDTLPATPDTGAATLEGARLPASERDVTIRVRRRSTEPLGAFAPGSSARMEATAAVVVHPR